MFYQLGDVSKAKQGFKSTLADGISPDVVTCWAWMNGQSTEQCKRLNYCDGACC